jgi:hypothetical protein
VRRGLPANGGATRDGARRTVSAPRRPSSSAQPSPWWHRALLWIAMLASAPLLNPNFSAAGDRREELIRLGVACLGFLALWMSYRLALRFAAPGAALLATVAMWLASSLPVYLYLSPVTTAVAAMFAATLFLTVLLSVRNGQRSNARWLGWAVAGGFAIAGLWVTAGPRPVMNWAHPQLSAAAFSAGQAALVWTPILLIAAAGLIIAILRQPGAGAELAAAGALFFYLSAAYGGPAGASYGSRLLIPLTPILLCGLSALVDTLVGNRGRLAWAGALSAVLILVLWNAGLILQWRTGLVGDRGPVSVRQAAAHQVTAVPSAVKGFVIRYVHDWTGLVNHLARGSRE